MHINITEKQYMCLNLLTQILYAKYQTSMHSSIIYLDIYHFELAPVAQLSCFKSANF